MNVRPITSQERKNALKFYWLIIPLVLIAGLIIYVLINAESLPLAARIAGSVIISGAIVAFTAKWIQLSKDLKEGEVTEVVGVLNRKIKLGGKNFSGASGGVGKMSRKNSSSSATYTLEINGNRYDVKSKHYVRVKEGKRVQLNYLIKSKLVLDVFQLNDN